MARRRKKDSKKKNKAADTVEDGTTQTSPSSGVETEIGAETAPSSPPQPKAVDEMTPEELEEIMQKLGAVEHETLEQDRTKADEEACEEEDASDPKKDEAAYQDEYLRKHAELDNYKKRMEREKADYLDYANVELIKLMLPSIDNLERALTHSGEDSEIETLRQGIELTLKDLHAALVKFGLDHIKAEGAKFDPTLHEAISQVESTEHDDGTVTKELQKGYRLKDRLIRPSLVVVADNPRVATDSSSTEDTDSKKDNGEDTDTRH